jgi:hypothetical protein
MEYIVKYLSVMLHGEEGMYEFTGMEVCVIINKGGTNYVVPINFRQLSWDFGHSS